ncbi:MAG: NAD(P)/FAD-dependent oxidoreductase [Rhodocyclaceae bacterium]
MKRRDFLKTALGSGLGFAAAPRSLLAAPSGVSAAGGARVVVIGGGMGGSTVAKYLRLWSGGTIDVTLIERRGRYDSHILSNLILNGERTPESLRFGHGTLASRYRVKVVNGEVGSIDAVARTVTMRSGERFGYERLVVAPGVDFDRLPGLESLSRATKISQAWGSAAETVALREMIRSMPDGGTVALTIPAAPFRGPAAPYERACVLARWLQRDKPGSRILVLDANPDIVAASGPFTEAFERDYRDVLEYRPGVAVHAADPGTMRLHTSEGSVRADVINVIPAQRAAAVLRDNGLLAAGRRWAEVDPLSYESRIAPDVHVIGDAVAGRQPRTGYLANQQAKVCAGAIVALLAGRPVDPMPMTHSLSYAVLGPGTIGRTLEIFAYDRGSRSMATVRSVARTLREPARMAKWYATLMDDTFA